MGRPGLRAEQKGELWARWRPTLPRYPAGRRKRSARTTPRTTRARPTLTRTASLSRNAGIAPAKPACAPRARQPDGIGEVTTGSLWIVR